MAAFTTDGRPARSSAAVRWQNRICLASARRCAVPIGDLPLGVRGVHPGGILAVVPVARCSGGRRQQVGQSRAAIMPGARINSSRERRRSGISGAPESRRQVPRDSARSANWSSMAGARLPVRRAIGRAVAILRERESVTSQCRAVVELQPALKVLGRRVASLQEERRLAHRVDAVAVGSSVAAARKSRAAKIEVLGRRYVSPRAAGGSTRVVRAHNDGAAEVFDGRERRTCASAASLAVTNRR